MVSIDLKDAYLQVPVHPDSCQFLSFMVDGMVYQFRVLCFSLSTAPQAFTRVMAPVPVMLHAMGIWMLQYLDDWLILAFFRSEALWARDQVLSLCNHLGIVINAVKSFLQPTQTFRSPERVSTLLTQITKFPFYRRQNVVSWHCLLGRLSSLCHLVPGGCLHMRSLQLLLRDHWDFVNESVILAWISTARCATAHAQMYLF